MYRKYNCINHLFFWGVHGKFITGPPNNTKLKRYPTLKTAYYVTMTYMSVCVFLCVLFIYICIFNIFLNILLILVKLTFD